VCIRSVELVRGVVLGDVDREVAVGEAVGERRAEGGGRRVQEGCYAQVDVGVVWRRGDL
jgi:hypothetical protein